MIYPPKMRCNSFVSTSLSKNLRLHHMPTPKVSKAYLYGVLHDSTERRYTYRICQKYSEYINFLAFAINRLGYKSWVYKEGANRNLYVVEFSKKLLVGFHPTTLEEKRDYVRGYFDTEGCIPRSFSSRYYLYFSQKNLCDLTLLRNYLLELHFTCGKIHNPSVKADPNYYRFYLLKDSLYKFGKEIGSYHPIKSGFLRMKI